MMNFIGSKQDSCGCQCPTMAPTYQQCNQVVQTYNYEDIPHYINYHTHIVNNCVKRHVNVPTCSASTENVVINEYVPTPQMMPSYIPQQPYPYGQMTQYQGNVGVEGYQQQMSNPYQSMMNQVNPFPQMPNMMNPFGN